MRQLAAMDMDAAELGAAMELREHLAGVQQTVRVEGAFEALLMGEVGFVEHCSHEVALFDADPVLASASVTRCTAPRTRTWRLEDFQ